MTPITTADITVQARRVLAARLKLADITEVVVTERAKWETAFAEVLEAQKQAREEMTLAEAELRGLALQAYEATGDKHPAPGVGIREVTTVAYDPEEALVWAQEHGLFLTLDRKQFDSFARLTTDKLGFVQITKTAEATIVTDLSKVLAEAEAAKETSR